MFSCKTKTRTEPNLIRINKTELYKIHPSVLPKDLSWFSKCSQAVGELTQIFIPVTHVVFSCTFTSVFLPILWHPQCLQQLLQTWLHFQASQDWEKRKQQRCGFPHAKCSCEMVPKMLECSRLVTYTLPLCLYVSCRT